MSSVMSITAVESVRTIVADELAVIFKHSTRCPVSAGAKRAFDRFAAAYRGDGTFYLVNVVENRDVSDAISLQTGIPHQSPQVLIVRGGKAVWQTSHWNITEQALQDAMK